MPLLLFASENLRILENFQVMSIAMALFQKKKAMKVCWMMYPGGTDLNFPVIISVEYNTECSAEWSIEQLALAVGDVQSVMNTEKEVTKEML